MTNDQQAFNAHLASARIAVENTFGKCENWWTYNAFEQGLKSGNQPVAAYFYVGIMLQNLLTCLRGDQISLRFGCNPPT